MSKESRKKLLCDPISNLKEKINKLESAIIATAKAYRQIKYFQVAKDIEDILNAY